MQSLCSSFRMSSLTLQHTRAGLGLKNILPESWGASEKSLVWKEVSEAEGWGAAVGVRPMDVWGVYVLFEEEALKGEYSFRQQIVSNAFLIRLLPSSPLWRFHQWPMLLAVMRESSVLISQIGFGEPYHQRIYLNPNTLPLRLLDLMTHTIL